MHTTLLSKTAELLRTVLYFALPTISNIYSNEIQLQFEFSLFEYFFMFRKCMYSINKRILRTNEKTYITPMIKLILSSHKKKSILFLIEQHLVYLYIYQMSKIIFACCTFLSNIFSNTSSQIFFPYKIFINISKDQCPTNILFRY